MYTSWHPGVGAARLHVLMVGTSAPEVRLGELLGDMRTELPRARRADNVEQARRQLAEEHFDAVLVDDVPGAPAATVRALRDAARDTPIIVLADADEAGAAALEAGAQDYMLRGAHDGQALLRALRFAQEHGNVQAKLTLTSQRLESNTKLVANVFDAQEEERRRVARELHDAFGQTLTTLTIHLRSLENNVHSAPREVLAQRVAQARELAAQLVQETAHIGRALRPPALDHAGLGSALTQLAEDLRAASAMEVHCEGLRDDAAEGLDDAVQTALYRIAQEALNNSVKHAGASQAWVELERDVDVLRMVVTDDGQGFAVSDQARQPVGTGHGLTSMRERAAMLGGVALIESTPGEGTRVTVSVPVARRA